MKDSLGIIGSLLHYGLTIAFAGSAFLIFACLFFKGRLDMDEEAKYNMLNEDKHHE